MVILSCCRVRVSTRVTGAITRGSHVRGSHKGHLAVESTEEVDGELVVLATGKAEHNTVLVVLKVSLLRMPNHTFSREPNGEAMAIGARGRTWAHARR